MSRVGRKVLNWMPTYIPKATSLDRRWFVIDASGKVLGKVATAAATVLTGKRKPTYTPFLDTGDHVVVINADQVVLTGKKETDKIYHHHSGFMEVEAVAEELRQSLPIQRASAAAALVELVHHAPGAAPVQCRLVAIGDAQMRIAQPILAQVLAGAGDQHYLAAVAPGHLVDRRLQHRRQQAKAA